VSTQPWHDHRATPSPHYSPYPSTRLNKPGAQLLSAPDLLGTDKGDKGKDQSEEDPSDPSKGLGRDELGAVGKVGRAALLSSAERSGEGSNSDEPEEPAGRVSKVRGQVRQARICVGGGVDRDHIMTPVGHKKIHSREGQPDTVRSDAGNDAASAHEESSNVGTRKQESPPSEEAGNSQLYCMG
jgi:hypothetical protein